MTLRIHMIREERMYRSSECFRFLISKMRFRFGLLRTRKLLVALAISSTFFLMVMLPGIQRYNLALLPYGLLQGSELQTTNADTITKLRQACIDLERIKLIDYKSHNNHRDILISKKYNFSVCNVPKSGSTFMKQLVFYLNDPRDWTRINIRNVSRDRLYEAVEELQDEVFDLPRMKVHSKLSLTDIHLTLDEFIHSNTIKVTLARNPYSRLYSAYMDKIFVPVLWRLQKSVFRTKASHRKLGISFDERSCRAKYETFEDFLDTVLILAENAVSNSHWVPLSYLCAPCSSRPDVVIKQETYQSDVEYLLERLDVKGDKLKTIKQAMAKSGVQTDVYLKGLVKTMLTRAFQGTDGDCFSNIELANRVWHALKIQGQIYMSAPFPYAKLAKNRRFDADFAADVFLEEMRKLPITPEESRSQRKRALARAYRHVSQETLFMIQGLYYHDFKMFGYDFKPPSTHRE